VSGLRLTLRQPPPGRVDLSPLLPEWLAGLSPAAIAAIALPCGNRPLAAGDLFDIAAGDAADLVIIGGSDRLDQVGKGMTSGRITVEGEVGAYAGLAMTGGALRIAGKAGFAAAAMMRGGLMVIEGDAGDFLGGALPGEMRGMGGGLVIVRGNAGARVGDRMRRGVILVEGDLGADAGARLLAGTVIGLGSSGAYPGLGMKRGTLLLAKAPERLLPSFADCGRHELGFLALLFAHLRPHSQRLAALVPQLRATRRWAGDLAAGGKGEILVAG
jgi:formylmethanofuran dehydrogenase subunit C